MTAADTAAHAVDVAELRHRAEKSLPTVKNPRDWLIVNAAELLAVLDRADALAVQLAKAEARCGELVKALAKAEYIADDRGREHTAAFMDAPKGERGHAVAAAACAHVAEAIKTLAARTLQTDRATWPDRAAKALAPAPNGEKGADDHG